MFNLFFKRLFCKHDWKLICDEFDIHRYKRVFIYECKKCGKEKRKYVKW